MSDLYEYESLLERIRAISTLNSASAILGWDQELHMPPRGGKDRAAQLALLSSLAHERLTDPKLGEILDRLEAILERGQLPVEASVNIRETRRAYDRKRKLPCELVEQIASVRSLGMRAWREAREASNFKMFQPSLEEHLDLQKRAADAYGFETEPYDALLEEYEPGMSAAILEKMLRELGEVLAPIVRRLVAESPPMDRSIFAGFYSAEKQKQWARFLAQAAGFDFEAGRFDICTHAFTESVSIGDVRLTIRCNENDPLALTYSLLHETGHGLYEQGFDPQHQGTPMAQAVSLGIHESQSRLWENMVGRSRAFWEFALPRFKEIFAGTADELDTLTAFRCANEIKPAIRRVGSDELTYNLHILLRFELERQLINGDLLVAELPEAWNAAMKKYLDVTPCNDAEGVLQDVHWSMYSVGYFPTYALGNVYAAQIYEAAQRDLPGLEEGIARGDFQPLRSWLREKIHRHGMRYQAPELIELATGRPPSSEAFLNYLRRKFPVTSP